MADIKTLRATERIPYIRPNNTIYSGRYQIATYQEVLDQNASARLGELCGRASRVELFEGHARSGDVREARVSGRSLPWHDAVTAA